MKCLVWIVHYNSFSCSHNYEVNKYQGSLNLLYSDRTFPACRGVSPCSLVEYLQMWCLILCLTEGGNLTTFICIEVFIGANFLTVQ